MASIRRLDATSALICLYLCIQLWLPLSYYLITEDKTDEALAWRMFSDLQMADRNLEVRLEGHANASTSTTVNLQQHFSRTWQVRLRMGPKWVLREACDYLCERLTGAKHVTYCWHIEMWDGRKEVITETAQCSG